MVMMIFGLWRRAVLAGRAGGMPELKLIGGRGSPRADGGSRAIPKIGTMLWRHGLIIIP